METTNEFSQQASKILDAALFTVAKYAPYIYSHVLAMEMIEEPAVETAGMDDNYRMYYNPEWVVNEMSKKEDMAFVILHEWCHFVRKHGEDRVKHNYDPNIWNIATDLSINQMEFKKGSQGLKYKMGTGIHPKEATLKDLDLPMNQTEDQYYKLLLQKQEEQGEGDGEGDGEGKSGFGSGTNEGSGVTGSKAPWESKDAPRMSQAQIEAKIKSAAEAIAHAASSAKDPGEIPAGLRLWADKLTKPQVNWRQKMSSFIWGVKRTGSGRIDHSRHRRRRVNGKTMLMPRTKSIKPKVCFVMDTSGSMLDGSLEAGISEIYGSLGACDAWVVWCDTNPDGPHKVTSAKDLSRPVGGGGSDMHPGIDIAQGIKDCNMVITVTDGYVYWGDGCKIPHLAVVIEGADPCPFGETIHIKKKRR